jgi:hypothetical protein
VRLVVEPRVDRVVRLVRPVDPIAPFAYTAILVWVAVILAWFLVAAVASRLPGAAG